MNSQPAPLKTPEETSARQKVLGHDLLLGAIFDHTDVRDHEPLRKVNKAWQRAIDTPKLWQKRYAPSVIEPATRTVRTGFVPQFSAKSEDSIWHCSIPYIKTLRHASGAPWTLQSGLVQPLPQDPKTLRILDLVAELQCAGMHAPTNGKQLKRRRAESMKFLLDRAYRLNHGSPVAVYRADGRELFALMTDATLSFCAIMCLKQGYDYLSSWATRWAALVDLIVVGSRVLAVSCVVFVCLVSGRKEMYRNMFFGPVDARNLNRWARQSGSLLTDKNVRM